SLPAPPRRDLDAAPRPVGYNVRWRAPAAGPGHSVEFAVTPARRAAHRLLLIGCLVPGSLLAQERVDPIPDGPASIVGALSPFTGNPDSREVANLLRDEEAGGFPDSNADHVLVARLWRRAGRT